jgi:hypothetical protein
MQKLVGFPLVWIREGGPLWVERLCITAVHLRIDLMILIKTVYGDCYFF